MSESVTGSNIEELVQAFKSTENPQQISVKAEHHEQWMNNSVFFREITEEISKLPTASTVPKESPSKKVQKESGEDDTREIKLYSAAQFRSHINRVYPFHLDYFTAKLSALDFEQHRMGLYVFYDVKNGFLINDLEKETQKKTNRGKNMKRMNGLLLNEHRTFNECAKEYAVQHLNRDYEAIKPAVNRFMEAWLQRKTDVVLKQTSSYSQRMTIPFSSYDSISTVTFINLSTVLRVGTIPLLTVPQNIERGHLKCSDNHDQIITNRFNPTYRFTNIADDPNILSILSQHPSIDIIISKSSFHLLLELFSTSACSSPLTLPISIREFQYETLENPNQVTKKKVIFMDKSFRQQAYTKRELNEKFYQRSFRSLLLSTTGGKRDVTDNAFNYTTFNNKTDFQITEIKNKVSKQPVKEEIIEKEQEDEEEEEDEEVGMVISTDGDNEEQQKLFQKSKQKIIHSAPIIHEKDSDEDSNPGPVPVVTQIKLATPAQGNYEYCLWQLGTLQILIRSSFHGFCHRTPPDEEYVTCHSKLEYQPQFGFEQIMDKEYRMLWCESYLRHGASVLLGRVNVYTQQVMKIEKMTYEDIDRNLKECQIDMLKPLTKLYGLLYGIQSLEVNNYLLSCSLNDDKLLLYQPVSNESEESTFAANDLLVQSDCTTVPWTPLTPTLLLPYHVDFERIPLTFCPRNKRQLDIEITIPAHRIPRKPVNQQERKQKKRQKKKANQRRKRTTKD